MDTLYVYGFMRAKDVPAELASGVGDPPGAVEAVTHGELAALVTAVGEDGVAPRRGNLLAHAEVLRRAGEHGPVLPLRFGEAVGGEDAVRTHLDTRSAELAELLAAFEHRVEFTVTAMYREDVVLPEILADSPPIGELRQAMAGKSEAETHFMRIRLGELVSEAVQARRERDGATILAELDRVADAVEPAPPMHEWMVVNAACLVGRDQAAAIDAAVERASEERSARMQFRLLGPHPPHAFVGGVSWG